MTLGIRYDRPVPGVQVPGVPHVIVLDFNSS